MDSTNGPGPLLTLGRSYWECRILLTGAELDLFTLLAPRALSAAEVTQHLAGDQRAVTILLDALAAMGLLHKDAGRYQCPRDVAAHLSADSPQSILPMLQHMAGLWAGWSELTGIVRGDAGARARAHYPQSDAQIEAFIGAMHVLAIPRAPGVIAAIGAGPARKLLDVGGGPGTYTLAFLQAHPQMTATLFDRPAVVDIARRNCTVAGLLDRVTLVPGDFEHDDLPPGHDLALLSAIIHQNSPAQNVALYRRVWHALQPGGRLVIRDHIASNDRIRPRSGAVFAVNMLVRTEGGNVYTFDDVQQTLTAAGFEAIRLLQTGSEDMNGLVEAFKPRA